MTTLVVNRINGKTANAKGVFTVDEVSPATFRT